MISVGGKPDKMRSQVMLCKGKTGHKDTLVALIVNSVLLQVGEENVNLICEKVPANTIVMFIIVLIVWCSDKHFVYASSAITKLKKSCVSYNRLRFVPCPLGICWWWPLRKASRWVSECVSASSHLQLPQSEQRRYCYLCLLSGGYRCILWQCRSPTWSASLNVF